MQHDISYFQLTASSSSVYDSLAADAKRLNARLPDDTQLASVFHIAAACRQGSRAAAAAAADSCGGDSRRQSGRQGSTAHMLASKKRARPQNTCAQLGKKRRRRS